MTPKRLDQIQLTPQQQVSLAAALRQHAEWWRAGTPDGEQAVDFETHMCAPWDQLAKRVLQVPRIEPGQVEQLARMFNTQELGWYGEPDFPADRTPDHMLEVVNAVAAAQSAGDAPATPAEPHDHVALRPATTPEIRQQWTRLHAEAREAVATARRTGAESFAADSETGAWELVDRLHQQIEEFEAVHGVVREAHTQVIEATRAASGGRIVLTELGENRVTAQPRRPGTGFGTTLPEVALSRWVPDSEGAHLSLRKEGAWAPATDNEAAAALGIEVSTWATCREAMEAGLATELGLVAKESRGPVTTEPRPPGGHEQSSAAERPALLPPGPTGQSHPEDHALGAPGMSAGRGVQP